MRNKLTTIAGILAGAPTLLLQFGVTLPPKAAAIVSGVGIILTGVFAKDAGTHSTTAETAQAQFLANEAKKQSLNR